MTAFAIAPVKDATIKITSRTTDPGVAVIAFDGVLGHRDPRPILEPLLTSVHEAARAAQIRKVVVDIRNLRFMNSSSFKHFVAWVKANNSLEAGQRYQLHFVLQPSHHWQKVSIHALGCFSTDPITSENATEDE